MQNLLSETLSCLKDNGKTEQDVVFCTDGNGYFSFDKFKEVCNIKYDSGYGGQEINASLMVVGRDWWLERAEYDGSEWWEFKSKPLKPKHKTHNPSIR